MCEVEFEQVARRVGHELRGVLEGEGHLEGECSKNKTGRGRETEPDWEAGEAVDQVLVDPEVGGADEDPEQGGVGVEVRLDDVRLAGKLLARLVPASDDARREEQGCGGEGLESGGCLASVKGERGSGEG